MVSDGQFVWDPNVGDFNIGAYLADRDSSLEPLAPDIELWASYSSVNPKVLITVPELRHGWVSDLSRNISEGEIRATIESVCCREHIKDRYSLPHVSELLAEQIGHAASINSDNKDRLPDQA